MDPPYSIEYQYQFQDQLIRFDPFPRRILSDSGQNDDL